MDPTALRLHLNSVANHALLHLRRRGLTPTEPVRGQADDGTTELHVIARPLGTASREGPLLATALLPFLFSPLETQVVQILLAVGAAHGGTLGKRTRHAESSGQANTKLRGVLANLVERQILTNDPTDGYRLSPEFAPLATTATGEPPAGKSA